VFECTACITSTLYALANCGPASLAMVLAYYGVDTSTWDLRVRARADASTDCTNGSRSSFAAQFWPRRPRPAWASPS
jgi:hypothetical protein